ncbi:MAG: TVP38/TMEM64 family protein, partial [Psychrobacillus sp.]
MKKKKTTLSKKQWILIGGFLFLIFFFSINQDLISILLDGDVDKAKTFLDKNIAYALFFMALVMVIQNSFTVFPLILVITINIALFGFVNGFLWSWFTSVLASIIVFYGVRYIFQSMIIHKFDAKIIEKV